MRYNILAICDEQVVYSDFFTKQLLRIDDETFQICRFSTFSQLELFYLENDIECLVISEAYEEELDRVKANYCFCLTMDRMKSRIKPSRDEEKSGMEYLYRYQSIEDIYEKLRGALVHQKKEKAVFLTQQEVLSTRLIGVYNPVHRNGQTTFAKALSTYYGKQNKRILYLSMEEYAGSSEPMKEETQSGSGDLGEVLYYLKQDIKSINFRLAAFIIREDYYETVRPIEVSSELRKITVEEWKAFLVEIVERSGYEIIVLDLDSCVQGLFEILDMCDVIYMPIRKDCTGDDKRLQFERNLKRVQKAHLADKILKRYITPVDTVNIGDIRRNVLMQVEAMFP